LFHIVGVKAHLAGHLPQQQIDVPDEPVHDSRHHQRHDCQTDAEP
jgi:hypothetical protein